MTRRRSFVVDAESVQGIPGAEITFKCLTVGTVDEYRTNDEMTDSDLLCMQILSWKGIVDDNDKELPSPSDEPGILKKLYTHEMRKMSALLFAGPDGDSAKN